MNPVHEPTRYWSKSPTEMLAIMGSHREGLSSEEVKERFKLYGRNILTKQKRHESLALFLERFRNPLIWILIFAAVVALIAREWLDALVVLAIVFLSAFLSFIQEYQASNAVEKLRRQVSARALVLREKEQVAVQIEDIVPGDIILLSAGSLIPADGLVLEAKDCYISQALLTGETFPVEKSPGIVPENASLSERENCVFMGTSVRSGTAVALIVQTGSNTEYGQIAARLNQRPPENELERGLRRFGSLLLRIMLAVVVTVMAVNMLLHRAPIDTILFAVSLAVAISPELLPAILAITLARGARDMAARGVIVRRLNAIENLGSMNVLCTDKTGTLTEGVIQLDGALNPEGQPSEAVLYLSFVNAHFQAGMENPLDTAVNLKAAESGSTLKGVQKLDEIPYDFVRKRLGIVVSMPGSDKPLLIVKGAFTNILEVCTRVIQNGMPQPLSDDLRQRLSNQFAAWSEQGYRVLGVAQKRMEPKITYGRTDEQALDFAGFLLFFDPPEPEVRNVIDGLHQLGVTLKIITGDNHLVARHVAEAVGIEVNRIVTGSELLQMNDDALWQLAPQVTIFAEVDPNQKERIIRSLQKNGHVVGYLGDGINDAPALHAADVGISVDKAVDVAKEAAEFVLLEHNLALVLDGINQGRHTFANTLKYIFITTSANFGNMISMAVASIVLPFLPLLGKQVLLNNFLSDIPAMGIAGDNVDREWESTPHRWDIHLIRNFMIVFGLVSTCFDLLTFGVLLILFHDSPEMFRTGWFIESLLTELGIIFVIRTYKPFYASRPGRLLFYSTVAVIVVAILLPYSPLRSLFDFVALPLSTIVAMLIITVFYIAISELTKGFFFKRFHI